MDPKQNLLRLRFFQSPAPRPGIEVARRIVDEMVYHETEGKLRWAPHKKGWAGKEVGGLRREGLYREGGYRIVQMLGKTLRCSDIAWFLYTGDWPTCSMAFRDFNPRNLRPDNMYQSNRHGEDLPQNMWLKGIAAPDPSCLAKYPPVSAALVLALQ